MILFDLLLLKVDSGAFASCFELELETLLLSLEYGSLT